MCDWVSACHLYSEKNWSLNKTVLGSLEINQWKKKKITRANFRAVSQWLGICPIFVIGKTRNKIDPYFVGYNKVES